MKRSGRLEITTVIGCSINCVYCPQKLLMEQYFATNKNRISKLDLNKFICCLEKLPTGTRIDFSGMAEPWLNRQCTDMICYAAERGFPISVYTTLTGMSKMDFDRIKDISFEEFVLHIPDDKNNAHINITKEYIDLLLDVINYKKNGISIVTGYSCHAGLHSAIKNAIPENSVLITELISRAGNINDNHVKNKNNIGEIVCVNCDNNINHNVLLPDGTVLLCCMDYGMKHVLGNLLECTYNEILNSAEAYVVRNGMKNENQEILCRNCTNARNIHELFEEYILANDWCKGLLKNEEIKDANLNIYKNWIENYQEVEKNLKAEIQRLTEQYDLRIKELADYREWVNNYEILEKQLREELVNARSSNHST